MMISLISLAAGMVNFLAVAGLHQPEDVKGSLPNDKDLIGT